jgi:hypothetical protein
LIKDFSKAFPNVPLVVCLSSYNWGKCMAHLNELRQIASMCQRGNNIGRFLMVYIQEGNIQYIYSSCKYYIIVK